MKHIVIMAGFESFNADLYRQAAQKAMIGCPDLKVSVFCDRDLTQQPQAIEQALATADVFFASLIFDYDPVLWLREWVQSIPIRVVSQPWNCRSDGKFSAMRIR